MNYLKIKKADFKSLEHINYFEDSNLLQIDYLYTYIEQQYENDLRDYSFNIMDLLINKLSMRCFLIDSNLFVDKKLSRKIISKGLIDLKMVEFIVDIFPNHILKVRIEEILAKEDFVKCISYIFTGSHMVNQSFLFVTNNSLSLVENEVQFSKFYIPKIDKYGYLKSYEPNFEFIFSQMNRNSYCLFPIDGGFDLGGFVFLTNLPNP